MDRRVFHKVLGLSSLCSQWLLKGVGPLFGTGGHHPKVYERNGSVPATVVLKCRSGALQL